MLKHFAISDIKKPGVFMVSTTAFISFCALKFLLKDVTSCLHLKGRGFPHVPSKVLIGGKLVLTPEYQF